MVESREDERAMSKDVDGGEMLEYGEEKKIPWAYLDMLNRVLKSCGYATHIVERCREAKVIFVCVQPLRCCGGSIVSRFQMHAYNG